MKRKPASVKVSGAWPQEGGGHAASPGQCGGCTAGVEAAGEEAYWVRWWDAEWREVSVAEC